MNIAISGRKINVSDALKDYVNEKLEKACESFESATIDADVVLREQNFHKGPNTAICEITLRAKGSVIRVSERSDNLHNAIDEACNILSRQVRKYKTKVLDKNFSPNIPKNKREYIPLDIDSLIDESHYDDEEDMDDLLVREKELPIEPMTKEYALVQTDLLGHDFYVYFDQDDKQINVIYHRQNGGYGIIKPKVVIS
ncbi:MAG: ribosome-associated translation inhibitor RaiA [Coriobacteriales bacterium]|nr:ribosome-associated translation inhibitor RaiA [Coriobacteriales bacterium]